MKPNDIKTKCLAVVETLDDFSTKLEDIDQNTEDYCAYITSLADIYYWLSIETIWGKMGFQWDVLDARGHFTKTTFNYTIIPRIPDGHRIKSILGLLGDLEKDTIIIQKSDWSNLTAFGGMMKAKNSYADPIKNIYADFTGANFKEYVGNYQYFVLASGDNYFKMDLKQLTRIQFEQYTYADSYGGPRFIIDDDNKGINCPMECGIEGIIIIWRGTGPYKDEYMFNLTSNSFYQNVALTLCSENNKYHLKNILNSYKIKLKDTSTSSLNVQNIETIIENIKKEDPIELCIEMIDGGTKDVKLKFTTAYTLAQESKYAACYKEMKINIIGEFDSITYYKSSNLILKEYGEFINQFDKTILPKITSFDSKYGPCGIFSNCIFDYIPNYEWDVKDLNNLCVYHQSIFYLKDCESGQQLRKRLKNGNSWDYYFYYYENIIELITIKNYHKDLNLYLPYCRIISKEFNSLQMSLQKDTDIICNTIKCSYTWSGIACYIVPEFTTVQTNSISQCCLRLFHNKPSIIIDCLTVRNIDRGSVELLWDDTHTLSKDDQINIFNVINFDKNNCDNLKTASITTEHGVDNGQTIIHPLIISNKTLYSKFNIFTNVLFICKATCDFSSIIRGQEFVNQLVEALEPNDSTSTYTITLRNEDYLLLTQEQIEHITVTCNYILVNKIV